MTKSKIEWTDVVWNPVRGCSRVSEGCRNCYAERQAARFAGPGQPLEGYVSVASQVSGLRYEHVAAAGSWTEPRWTGRVDLIESKLAEPLSWRRPRRVFVNSMSDLFHESLSVEAIDRVFAVMALCRQHTFQVLTKRPERMRAYIEGGAAWDAAHDDRPGHKHRRAAMAREHGGELRLQSWPLPNVWLGTSIEDQASADARIPHLLATPAAVRFVSAEPLLGPIDLLGGRTRVGIDWLTRRSRTHMRADVEGMLRNKSFGALQHDDGREMSRDEARRELERLHDAGVKFIPVASDCAGFDPNSGCPGHRVPTLDQVIVGGESGPGARPCDVGWIRSIVEQCKAARVPVFVKQLGAKPIALAAPLAIEQSAESILRHGEYDPDPIEFDLRHPKGGDPSEWPEDLRVREFPGGVA